MKYFLRKFGFFLLTLWAVVTLNFLIPRLQPGDPAEIMVQSLAGKDAQLDQAQVAGDAGHARHPDRLAAGRSTVQYLGQLLHGNFGVSYNYFPFKVTEVIGQAFWWTAILVTVVQVLSFLDRHAARRVRRLAPQQPVRHRRDAGLDLPRHACSRSGSRCC